MNASSCVAPDTVLDLFGPETDTSQGASLIKNDDGGQAPCTLDAAISTTTSSRSATA